MSGLCVNEPVRFGRRHWYRGEQESPFVSPACPFSRASEISCGRGAAKFRDIREIPRNPAKYSEICLKFYQTRRYNIFETYLGFWSCLLAVNVQIYLESSSLPRGKNIPKLPGVLRLMLRKPGHNKREDFSLTLYGM